MYSHAFYHEQMAGLLDDYDRETLRRLRRYAGITEDDVLALDAPEEE
jgi:hypothetical protein